MKKLLLSALLLGGCASGQTTYTHLSHDEAKDFMEQEECIVLDVRTSAEFEDGHIPNAILLPVDQVKDKAEEVLPDRESQILIYCRSGRRALKAAQHLVDMGYSHVYEFGGIIDWPYDIVQ